VNTVSQTVPPGRISPANLDTAKTFVIRPAVKRVEVLQCQYFIAEIYNRHYGIVFSNDITDLDQRIEPYPDRYVMGLIDGYLVAAAGLYTRRTYVETYGNVNTEDLDQMIAEAGMAGRYSGARRREYTKLVIRKGYGGRGIGKFFHAATHTRSFLEIDAEQTHVLVVCAKQSIYRAMYPEERIRTRVIKPFPHYAVHEQYCSKEDPMDSRLVIPSIDIAPAWYNRELPGEFQLEAIYEDRFLEA